MFNTTLCTICRTIKLNSCYWITIPWKCITLAISKFIPANYNLAFALKLSLNFTFYSSAEAKQDFTKIIRQTIRDSVRRMSLPNGGTQPNKKTYMPYGGKRLSSLQGSNIRTLSKIRGGQKSEDSAKERYSMDFEEKVTLLVESEPSIRTRSRTVGDLNDASLDIPENDPVSSITQSTPHLSPERKSSCSSNSNLSTSSRNSMSAKLTQASANPVTFSSSVNNSDGSGSPVWKPRNESNMAYIDGNHLAAPSNAVGSSLNTSQSSNIDCSDIVFRRNSKTIVLQQPHNFVKLKDTECWNRTRENNVILLILILFL